MGKALCYGIACCDILIPGIDAEDFKRENVRVDRFAYSTGGDAMNQAITLAKLGHEAVLLTTLGKDLISDFLVKNAESSGLNMDHVIYTDEKPTSLTLVCVHKDGNRSFIFNDGADNLIGAENVSEDMMDGAGVFGVGSAFGAPKLTKDLPQILKAAKEKGLKTCVDIMQGSEFPDPKPQGAEEFLQYADYLFPNENEGYFLTGLTGRDEMAEALLNMGVGCVVLKTGSEGCRLYRKGQSPVDVPGFKVDMIDTTGAGDNFMAGFMAGLLEGLDDIGCARLANASGAAAVRYIGAAGMKNREEVEEILNQR